MITRARQDPPLQLPRNDSSYSAAVLAEGKRKERKHEREREREREGIQHP